MSTSRQSSKKNISPHGIKIYFSIMEHANICDIEYVVEAVFYSEQCKILVMIPYSSNSLDNNAPDQMYENRSQKLGNSVYLQSLCQNLEIRGNQAEIQDTNSREIPNLCKSSYQSHCQHSIINIPFHGLHLEFYIMTYCFVS